MTGTCSRDIQPDMAAVYGGRFIANEVRYPYHTEEYDIGHDWSLRVHNKRTAM